MPRPPLSTVLVHLHRDAFPVVYGAMSPQTVVVWLYTTAESFALPCLIGYQLGSGNPRSGMLPVLTLAIATGALKSAAAINADGQAEDIIKRSAESNPELMDVRPNGAV